MISGLFSQITAPRISGRRMRKLACVDYCPLQPLNEAEEILLHRNIKTNRETFLKVTEPIRFDIVIAVECILQRRTSVHPVESCLPR